jgi:hypothetical protein
MSEFLYLSRHVTVNATAVARASDSRAPCSAASPDARCARAGSLEARLAHRDLAAARASPRRGAPRAISRSKPRETRRRRRRDDAPTRATRDAEND